MLPGGYLYMTDMLGQPGLLADVGRMFATAFADGDIDVIMTVETKGIPLAYATAACMNLPVVIVRRDNKVRKARPSALIMYPVRTNAFRRCLLLAARLRSIRVCSS